MMNGTNKKCRLVAACAGTTLGAILCSPTYAAPEREPAALQAGKARVGKAAAGHGVSPSYNYVLDVDPNPYAYTVRLNGWVVSESPGDANDHFSSGRMGMYLAEGRNTVSVHIGPPPKGVSPGHTFGVRVRGVEGTLLNYLWGPAKPHTPLPVQAEAHFDARLPLGPWAWQTAPRITLDAPAKAAINAHVKRLFDALDAKNVADATALFALMNREAAAMSGTSAAEAEAASRKDWAKEFADPHWRMDPIGYARLRYTLEADGRAVLVLRADGGDVLRTVPDTSGNFGSYDVNLSLVHGQWALIRQNGD